VLLIHQLSFNSLLRKSQASFNLLHRQSLLSATCNAPACRQFYTQLVVAHQTAQLPPHHLLAPLAVQRACSASVAAAPPLRQTATKAKQHSTEYVSTGLKSRVSFQSS
jgi:hypothetical protein